MSEDWKQHWTDQEVDDFCKSIDESCDWVNDEKTGLLKRGPDGKPLKREHKNTLPKPPKE